MTNLRFFTSGESHGRAIIGILEGVPAGLSVSSEYIDKDLLRRQKGYGRGARMKIESDTARILSGIRRGKTLGSPITLLIENKDWPHWQDVMNSEIRNLPAGRQGPKSEISGAVTRPRPGHADLAGAIKYNTHDIRNVLERSSARETAARVAVGAIAKKLLSEFNIKIMSYVEGIGKVNYKLQSSDKMLLEIFEKAEKSSVRCPDANASKKMIKLIDKAIKEGNSLGGVFKVVVTGTPVGLGSYSHWDRRLDARLAHALMSIQAIKGVETGLGFEMSGKFGSEVMDEIYYDGSRFYRKTNNAGGIEGGISNGMPIVLRAAMKPIPTQRAPLSSVDIISKKAFKAVYERSDICAVPAASVIGEAMTALVIADSFLEKFGGDSMEEIKRNYKGYLKQINRF